MRWFCTAGSEGSGTRRLYECRGVVTTALPLSSSYSPFADVKVVLPEGSSTLTALRMRRVRFVVREGGRASRSIISFHLSGDRRTSRPSSMI